MSDKPITINILQNKQIVYTYHPDSKAEANRIFYRADIDSQYPQLIVGKRTYTLAQAYRYLGAREEYIAPMVKERRNEDGANL